jgi:hypothetical protein
MNIYRREGRNMTVAICLKLLGGHEATNFNRTLLSLPGGFSY